jgi:hypothetical protein
MCVSSFQFVYYLTLGIFYNWANKIHILFFCWIECISCFVFWFACVSIICVWYFLDSLGLHISFSHEKISNYYLRRNCYVFFFNFYCLVTFLLFNFDIIFSWLLFYNIDLFSRKFLWCLLHSLKSEIGSLTDNCSNWRMMTNSFN